MMRFVLVMLASAWASQAAAQSINWIAHRAGQKVPATAIAGGNSGATIYYLCRKHMNGRWHPGYTAGSHCHTALGKKERRHKKYQLAMPGKHAKSLSWRDRNNMEKHPRIRAGKKADNPPICRGMHEGRFHLIGHQVKGGCRAGFNKRSVLLTAYQLLSVSYARTGLLKDLLRTQGGKDVLGLDKPGPIDPAALSRPVPAKADPK